MTLQLHCVDSKGSTKSVNLDPAKPVRVRCRDAQGREVIMAFTLTSPLRCNLSCAGPGLALLDGMGVNEADLDAGSVVQVGKQSFEVAHIESAVTVPRGIKNAEHFEQQCSHCQAPFSTNDCANGWVDGPFRICSNCLTKGVRPQHLTAWRHSLEVDVDASTDEFNEVAGVETHAQGANRPRRTISSGPIPALSSESRPRRRISASANASVENTSAKGGNSGGIIGKVTRVFRRRASEDGSLDRERMEDLENQRAVLLAEAGRLSLTQMGGQGLPVGVISQLSHGQPVAFTIDDCDRSALSDWRARQRQLAHLDAEISAMRIEMGMGSDPALPAAQVTLRTEERALENRAFLASDALLTEDLGSYVPEDPSSQDETESYAKPAAAGSGEPEQHEEPRPGHSNRRPVHRRRRR